MMGVGAEVQLHIAFAEVDGFLADIHGLHIFGTATESSEGEAPSVAETVEDTVSLGEAYWRFTPYRSCSSQ